MMRNMLWGVAVAVMLCDARSTAAQEKQLDFAHDVVPVLKKHCAACHTNGTYKGGLSLDTREELVAAKVVVPGRPGENELLARVTSTDVDLQMPPRERPRLSDAEVAVLRRWIREGLAWEDGYTFKAADYVAPLLPRRPELPPVVAGRTNPIDRFVDAYFAAQQLERPEPVDDATFLRRAQLDVIGLLPDQPALEAFLADGGSDKRERLIESLLGRHRDYAEHWLTFWNDLLRNDYAGTGYIDGGRKQISGWLYQALLENKPYDQFVRELISPSPESEGFVQGIKWRGTVNASQVREIQFAQNVSQVFLGINMKCASCHDSFIDHWKLEQAYGLGAIYATEPLQIHRCDKPTGETAAPAFIFPELGAIDPQAPQPQRLEQLARLMTSDQNGRLTRTIVNRLWHRLMGRGIVHPVDAMGTRPWNEDLLDYLAVHLAEHDYDLKATLRLILNSEIYQSRCVAVTDLEREGRYRFRGPQAKRLTAEQFVDAVWALTNTAPGKPDAPVAWDGGDGRRVRAALVKSDLLMRSLGRPNREQVVTSRPDQLTTLEAIDLANGEILARLLAQGAPHWLERHAGKPAELMEELYLAALSRRPNAEELRQGLECIGSPPRPEGVEDLLWIILMLPEFQLIR